MTVALDPLSSTSPESPIGRDYVSWSALSTFRQCPLRFHFKYVRGLPEETVSSSLVLGGAIHGALEHHFRELREGGEPPDVDVLLEVTGEEWRNRDAGTIRYGRGESADTLRESAARMLRAFSRSEVARPKGPVVGVERTLRGPVVDGLPEFLGRVDLLVEEPDGLVLTDFKTSRTRWTPDRVEEAGDQLLLYHELARGLRPELVRRLVFAVITKGREPVVELHPVPVDPRRLARARRIAARLWEAITAGHVWPNPSPLHCPGCPYREACRAWRG